MKILNFLLTLSLSVTPSMALCKIAVADSMKAVQAIFEQFSGGDTLGLFDIDMVLIQSSIPAFQMANMKKYKTALKALLEPLTPLEKDMTLMLTLKQGHAILIEAQTPCIIENIRKKTSKLIALTSTLTGQWDQVDDGTLFRVEQLNSIGIDFSSSFPTLQSLIFNEMKAYRNQYSEFKQGVLSANGDQKGAALIAFLKCIDFKPNAIIFVDDRESNIIDVKKTLSASHPSIHFTGILYKGSADYPSELIDEPSFKAAWREKIQQEKQMLQFSEIEN